MGKYYITKYYISYDSAEVEADSVDEAINKLLDGDYELVGPDGILEHYNLIGISFDDLRAKGVTEKTIERIMIEYNDEEANNKGYFGGIGDIT